jgi:hypothetical protein
MSFVSKAVKKVFGVVKKAVKFVKRAWDSPWVRTAFMVAATVFTAGLASGGWAAFSQSAFSQGIGGFFSAVGNTMASGFSNIVAGFKGLGTSAQNLMTAGKATAQGTQLVNTGLNSQVLASVAQATGNAATLSSTAQTTGNILSRITGSIFSDSPSGDFLRKGIVGGIGMYMKQRALDDERERRDSATVFGGPAFGGSSELGFDLLRPTAKSADTAAGAIAQTQAGGLVAPPGEEAPQFAATDIQTAPQQEFNPLAPIQPTTQDSRVQSRQDLGLLGVA